MAFYGKFGTNCSNIKNENSACKTIFSKKSLISGKKKTFFEEKLLYYQLSLRVQIANQLIMVYVADSMNKK